MQQWDASFLKAFFYLINPICTDCMCDAEHKDTLMNEQRSLPVG